MNMFIIAGHDYTNNLVVPDYKVNEEDVYEEWDDGNNITHRDVFRQRVSGSFVMFFASQIEFDDFFKVLNDNKQKGGYVPASLYVTNKNELHSGNYYFSAKPANTKPLYGMKEYEGFVVDVSER